MKKLHRVCALLLAVCLMAALLTACGSNPAEPFIGVWYGTKVSTPTGDVVFAEYESIIKMELTAEFSSDGSYELHYYVAGQEGKQYCVPPRGIV